jgi:hypothetical protein
MGLFCPLMRLYRYLYIFYCLGVSSAYAQILPSFGNSRTGGTGMQFLKISPDARSMSLAGAAVAVANDASAMYWNPAGITGVDTGKVNLMVSHSRYFGDINANYAGAVIRAGRHSFVGVQVFSMDYGDMKETTEFDPSGTGRTFGINNYFIGLTYAKVLTNNFSFGLNGKYTNESFAGINVHNVLFDLGLKYDVGVKHTRFGVNFSNFGLNVKPSGGVQVLKFDGMQNISNFSDISVPALFRLGIAFDPVHTNEHVLTLAGQLNHPTDNNETYVLAAEYSYLKIGYLRTGYEFGSDENYIGPSAGIGMKILRRFGGLTFDYGFVAKNRLGYNQRITLAILVR